MTDREITKERRLSTSVAGLPRGLAAGLLRGLSAGRCRGVAVGLARSLSAALALAAALAPLLHLGLTDDARAHHSFSAVFDADSPIELTGVVTDVEWMNPHVWIYVDVAGAGEAVEGWAFELGSTTGLRRSGWSRDTVQAGDRITIAGYRAKDGSMRGNVSSITLDNGTTVSGNSSRSQ